jgi:hypothetical protein
MRAERAVGSKILFVVVLAAWPRLVLSQGGSCADSSDCNHGTCTTNPGTLTKKCVCNDGWGGDNCGKDQRCDGIKCDCGGCTHNSCHDNGQCNCNAGYEPNGSGKCKKKSCGMPSVDEHSSGCRTSGQPYLFEDTCTAKCGQGFTGGSKKLTCQANGRFDNTLSCTCKSNLIARALWSH